MEHWIYKLRRERDEEQQRQTHFAKVFPVLAETLWVQLCNTIREDAQRMRQEFPELLPEALQFSVQPYSLRISYGAQPPYYFLGLTVNILEQTLIMQQIIANSSESCPQSLSESGPDTTLTLLFNEKQQRVQFSLNGQICPLEEVSEMCLRPIIDLHTVTIAKMIGARAA